MLERVSVSVANVSAAQDIDALKQALQDGVRLLGFANFNLGLNKRRPIEFMEEPTLTTWPDSNLEAYLNGNWGEQDPLQRWVIERRTPFLWTTDGLRGTGHHVYAEYLEGFDVYGGATVPLPHSSGRVEAMTLLPTSAAVLTPDALHACHVLAHIARARAALLRENIACSDQSLEGFRSLSTHQREILQWVARGKTNREIAIILGSTRRTIDYHLQEILRKLGVTSRTQAVAIFARAEG